MDTSELEILVQSAHSKSEEVWKELARHLERLAAVEEKLRARTKELDAEEKRLDEKRCVL